MAQILGIARVLHISRSWMVHRESIENLNKKSTFPLAKRNPEFLTTLLNLPVCVREKKMSAEPEAKRVLLNPEEESNVCLGITELPADILLLSMGGIKGACRGCTVSRNFRKALESDGLWEKIVPSDVPAIISRSSVHLDFSSMTMKQLYLYLSDNPILIDHATKSFFLDKSSGKKCYLLSARELSIVWGNTTEYWRWISLPEAKAEASRFQEVAELNYVWFFDISGKMSTSILSPKTHYAAYLVYKLRNNAYGFGGRPFKASVGGGEVHEQTVHLDLFVMEPNQQHTSRPKQRKDGWLETELGQFFNEGGEDEELQIKLMELSNYTKKTGLIVEGIEIRPTKGAGQDQ